MIVESSCDTSSLFYSFCFSTIECLAQSDSAPSSDELFVEKLFAVKVRPLLVEKCGGCHGDAAKEGMCVREKERFFRGPTGVANQ